MLGNGWVFYVVGYYFIGVRVEWDSVFVIKIGNCFFYCIIDIDGYVNEWFIFVYNGIIYCVLLGKVCSKVKEGKEK